MKVPALLLAGSLLLGCTPVVSQRGYLPDPIGEAAIQIGKDTKATVQERLGDPSTEATFGGGSWYYISSIEKRIAFFDPRVENRSILAIHFDKDGKVSDIKHYTLKDGHVVAFETHETPAPGRELTFLQQLFNATPGIPLGGMGGEQPGGGANPYP